MADDRTRPDLVPAEALERERRAFAMRLRGATFAAIGKALGITPQGAHQAYLRALKRGREELAETVADQVTLDAARLDRLIRALWPAAVKPDHDAVDRVVKLLERRARLLGLDAPNRSELTGKGGDPLVPAYGVLLLPPEDPDGRSPGGVAAEPGAADAVPGVDGE